MDCLLLHAMRDVNRFTGLSPHIPRDLVGQDTLALLEWYKVYTRVYPGDTYIDLDKLSTLVSLKLSDPESVGIVQNVIQVVKNAHFSADSIAGVHTMLYEAKVAGAAAALITKYQSGGDVDIIQGLHTLTQDAMTSARNSAIESWDQSSIDSMLFENNPVGGIKWSLEPLRDYVGGIHAGDSVLVAARPDRGKCLAIGTGVRMGDGGCKPVEDVRVGDVVAGPYMNNTVMGVTRGVGEMYRVSYSWGESYMVNADHVLSLKRSATEGSHKCGDVLNVPVREYLKWPESRKRRYKGWKCGVDYPEQQLPIDPYILGVWLGDGTANKPQITNIDPEVIREVNAVYGPPTRIWKGKQHDYYKTPLLSQLRYLGVYHNKHIPDIYLRSSRQQRMELLAGIIDSDGYAGDVYEVVTKSPKLRDGYVQLARSLGYHAVSTPTWKHATNGSPVDKLYFRVRIGSEAFGEVPVRLRRKQGNHKTRKRHGLHFGIVVEPVGIGEYAGFSLTGDSLFLLEDFTVTHNSSFMAYTLTDWAAQVVQEFGEDRPMLWLINEGKSIRSRMRLYNAGLRMDTSKIAELGDNALINELYSQAINAPADYIRCKEIHGLSMYEVERIVEAVRPSVCVLDMVANVKVPSTDPVQAAEERWQRWREMLVRYDVIGIGTSQISAPGDGVMFPGYSHLKDSRTSVQAAVDVCVILGASNDPLLSKMRGISTPKNKRSMPGKPECVEAEVVFEKDTCEFL